MELFSERLKLRLIETSDLNAIHALYSLPETDRYNLETLLKTMKPQHNIGEYVFCVI